MLAFAPETKTWSLETAVLGAGTSRTEAMQMPHRKQNGKNQADGVSFLK